ncbi:MAG TPA: tetratricopeptide repeat protein [Candidatus Sulfotelmatobacter sp.]|nr:tetratricopeptide repeat protein [Candidatus Sulfotelmatobacter sp.]
MRGLAFGSRESFDSQSRAADAEFHLHPHYRAQRPLDATLLKTKAGLDDFVTEKYHDQIAARLAEWKSGLLASTQSVQVIEKLLAPDFSGVSLNPTESRLLGSSAALEARSIAFSPQTNLGGEAFLRELHSFMSAFSQLTTAEFQITSIEAAGANTSPSPSSMSKPPNLLRTRVRYELVGTGAGFYREQRVGNWNLEWGATPSGEFRLRSWGAAGETRSRSFSPIFADITAGALGSNASYSGQLLRGVDYWRTVLDGACGIDIYGHNGVSVADIDDDGFDDLYICQPAGLPNRLYRNRGDGTFEDITESSGLGILENTACALFGDFDNDGRQDVIVVRANGPLLFLNQGGGRFRRKADAFHFAQPPQGTFTGAALADYDRDGWLDIYFCLYTYYQGTDQYKYPVPYYAAENGPPNFMMRNQRDGTFRDVTAESSLNQNNTRYSFCCAWNDYDGDGWPDLYVVNDFGRKNLYHNHGDGTFADVAAEAGVEDVGAGMSVCWFDHDNDGADDLYVADMWTAAGERISRQDVFKGQSPQEIRALYRKHSMGNSLLRNTGTGSGSPPKPLAFEDTTIAAGVGNGRWSWSSDAWDFDHDGFPDLYIANGMISGPSHEDLNSFFWRQVVANSPDEARLSHDYEQGWSAVNELVRSDATWSGYERNVFYANNRDGTFSDVSGAVGLDFIEDGRAFALADFDHDGRQEVFLKNRNAPQLRVLKNVMQELPPAICFRLRGTKSNRDAVGAVVTIETATGRQTRTLQAGSGFLSQSSKELFFGLGEARGPVKASIRWPSGLMQQLHDLPSGHRIWVEEGSASFRAEPFRAQTSHPRSALAPQPPEQLPTSTETWLLSPMLAPDFSAADSSGQTRGLRALRGKPVLLNFWTTRSPTSQADLKMFTGVHARWASQGLQLLAVNFDEAIAAGGLQSPGGRPFTVPDVSFPILRGSEDVAAIYNIFYRYLFDRHRDLSLPTSFLINEQGEVVKVYQGAIDPHNVENDFRHIPRTPAERLVKALPWPGVSDSFEFARNYLSYGSIFFQRGYFEQAESSFRQALHDDPASAEALYGMGSACLNLQKIAEARASFQRATELQPSYPDTIPNAWNNLGLLATREGRTEEAVGYFQQALKLNPDHLIALENLGNAYRQQKDWEQARKILERAVAVSPGDPESTYSLGMVFAQTNDTARAYEYLQRALQARPVYPEALNNLGILYLRTQRRDEAVATFKECIRVAPAFDQAYLNLSRVYALEGTPEKARAVLIELLKQHPDHAQAQKELQQLQP